MRKGEINIGKFVKSSLKGKRGQYLIYRDLLDKELGKMVQ